MNEFANDDFDEKTARFRAWLSQSGVDVSPSIEIADLRSIGKGRGVVATKDIASGETLFTIKDRKTLIGGSTEHEHQHGHGHDDVAEDDPWTALLLKLLEETAKHDATTSTSSYWSAYLDILPCSPSFQTSEFDTLMFWSAAELAELQASTVVSKIGKDGAEASFRALLPRIKAQPARYGFSEQQSGNAAAYRSSELVQEAAFIGRAHILASLIMAYAFDVAPFPPRTREPDEDGYVTDDDDDELAALLPKAMVPLADLLNADAERNNARLFYEDDGSLVMRAVQDVAAGEELLNDYGALPRSELVRRYGYVTEGYARYDVVDVPLALFVDTAGTVFGLRFDEVVQKLSEKLDCEIDELPDSFELARADLEELDIVSVSAWTELFPVLRAVFSLQPEAKTHVNEYLSEVLRQRLAQYATTLQQDRAILGEMETTTVGTTSTTDRSALRMQMAVEVRMGEKEILEQALSILESEQDEDVHQRKRQKR